MPFLAWYAAMSALSFAAFAFCLAGTLASCAVVQIWTEKPGSGRDLRKRSQASKIVSFVEFLSAGGWAGACYLMMRGSWWAFAAVGVALLAPAAAWVLRRARRE